MLWTQRISRWRRALDTLARVVDFLDILGKFTLEISRMLEPWSRMPVKKASKLWRPTNNKVKPLKSSVAVCIVDSIFFLLQNTSCPGE